LSEELKTIARSCQKRLIGDDLNGRTGENIKDLLEVLIDLNNIIMKEN